MKTYISRITLSACLAFPLTALTGCLTHTPVVSAVQQPVVTEQAQTNQVQSVNPSTGIVTVVTNVVLVPVTNFIPVQVTNTVYAANAAQIASVASTVGSINAATAPVDPYSPLIATALPWGATAVLAISTGVAAFLNNKKSGIISAIVAGVEGAAGGGSDSAPITVAAVKASVAQQATLQGNLADVHAAVQANT